MEHNKKQKYNSSNNKQELSFFTRINLKRRGRSDSRKGAVRLLDGYYISPFIIQEMHICIAQICVEKEHLHNSIYPIQYSIEKNNYSLDNSLSVDEVNKDILANDKIRNILSLDKEILTYKYRCKELYNSLIARLSVYWNGVLIEQSSDMDYPAIFDVDQILKIILEEIDSIQLEVNNSTFPPTKSREDIEG